MGLLEKRRFKNFVVWANDFDEKQPSTYKGAADYMLWPLCEDVFSGKSKSNML